MFKFPTMRFALTAALGFSAVATAPTTAAAIEIYNCTNTHLPVAVTHVSSGRNYGSATIAPDHGAAWNTGRGEGFRVSINVIGPDKNFSRRNGGETISIVNMAGNTELVAGRQCPQRTVAPPPEPERRLGAEEISLAVGIINMLLEEAARAQ